MASREPLIPAESEGQYMKTYIATYWRGYPQLKSGGYVTTREFKARTMASARRKAKERSKMCVYGTLVLREVREKTEQGGAKG